MKVNWISILKLKNYKYWWDPSSETHQTNFEYLQNVTHEPSLTLHFSTIKPISYEIDMWKKKEVPPEIEPGTPLHSNPLFLPMPSHACDATRPAILYWQA